MKNHKLFFYGTLREPKIFEKVTKAKYGTSLIEEGKEGILKNFSAFYVQGEYFPGVKEIEGEDLEGLLVEVPDELLEFLMEYENPDDYLLVEKEIILSHDKSQVTSHFFLNTERLLLSDKKWTYSEFKNRGEDLEILSKIDQWMS